MICFRNLILEYCSNEKSKITFNYLLKFDKQIKIYIKLFLNKKINKLSSGILAELGIYFLFDDFKFEFSIKFKFKNCIPDCKINNIYLEIKNFRHDMTGTCDEKNASIPWKYFRLNKFDEKLLVIFCGKITKINKQLLIETKDLSQSYNNYTKFLGFFKFDDFNNIL